MARAPGAGGTNTAVPISRVGKRLTLKGNIRLGQAALLGPRHQLQGHPLAGHHGRAQSPQTRPPARPRRPSSARPSSRSPRARPRRQGQGQRSVRKRLGACPSGGSRSSRSPPPPRSAAESTSSAWAPSASTDPGLTRPSHTADVGWRTGRHGWGRHSCLSARRRNVTRGICGVALIALLAIVPAGCGSDNNDSAKAPTQGR